MTEPSHRFTALFICTTKPFSSIPECRPILHGFFPSYSYQIGTRSSGSSHIPSPSLIPYVIRAKQTAEKSLQRQQKRQNQPSPSVPSKTVGNGPARFRETFHRHRLPRFTTKAIRSQRKQWGRFCYVSQSETAEPSPAVSADKASATRVP